MRSVDPETVRALVREALAQRLGLRQPPAHTGHRDSSQHHPSYGEIFQEPGCGEDQDFSIRKPCLIEPHRICSNSGYCKKLGF